MKTTYHDFNKNKLTGMMEEVTKDIECQTYTQLGFTDLIGEGRITESQL